MPTKKKPDATAGPSASQRVSEHAQGFVFGFIAGVIGTLGVLWAVLEPIVR